MASGQPSAQAEMPAAATGSDTYGPVQKGDTLHKIAEGVKPSNVSLEQMLVALYRENKGAFSGGNMNRLKTGQILKVPSAEEVEKIEPKEANREYRTQVSDWKSYRDQLAGGVAASPAPAESSTSASGRISSAAVTPPPSSAPASGDVLKLSKSEAGKAGARAGAATQERMNALQEELTAKDKALRESQSRVADLEKQIRDMQRLAELKGGAAPGKESSKVAVAPVPPAASTKPVETPKPAEPAKPTEPPKVAETKPVEPPKPAVVADASKPAEAAKPAETTTTTTPPAGASKPAEPPTGAAPPKPAAPKKIVPPPPPPPSFVDEMMDNPLMLGGIGVAVLLAGAGAFLFMRRRRAANDGFDSPSQMTSSFPSDLKSGADTSKPAAGLVDTGNSSFLTDFDKTGPGTIDTDEVDPVAEAEVYIAYGRDAQAEEILKEAMARDRGRHEIALKLLEIYHARKSATAYETVAKELRSQVGEDSPLWQKAAAMGAQIDPNNPLYGGAASSGATFTSMAPAAPAPKPDLDFDIDAQAQHHPAAASSPSFDLNLDAEKSIPPGHSQSHGLDFDLEAPKKPAIDIPAEPVREEKPAFDFDLSGLEMPGASKKAEPSPDKAPSMDLADLNLDSPPAGGEGGEGVGTKLELAKAYLEIGDKDGAREILQEVAKEGSSAQRAEAQKLIATL
jgi:pilus assembly protein FimV